MSNKVIKIFFFAILSFCLMGAAPSEGIGLMDTILGIGDIPGITSVPGVGAVFMVLKLFRDVKKKNDEPSRAANEVAYLRRELETANERIGRLERILLELGIPELLDRAIEGPRGDSDE